MPRELLCSYLSDHLRGCNTALTILDRMIEECSDLKPFLQQLRKDTEADCQHLTSLMQRLGIGATQECKAIDWLADEDANGDAAIDNDGYLRRLEGLEALEMEIQGQFELWQALLAACETSPQLRGLDYRRLIRRAQERWDRVEIRRIETARSALSPAA